MKNKLVLDGLKPLVTCRASNINETLIRNIDIGCNAIVRVRGGPVRVEVYNSERNCISAEIFFSGTEFPLLFDTKFVTKANVREIRVVSLVCRSEVDCYEQEAYEDNWLANSPVKYRFNKRIQQQSLVNMFSTRQLALQRKGSLEKMYFIAVEQLMRYMVAEYDPNIIQQIYKNAKLINDPRGRLTIVHIGNQNEFATNCGISSASWSRVKEQYLIKLGIQVSVGHSKENYGLTIDVVELMNQHGETFNKVATQYNQEVDQFKICNF